jgi:hypothetical protein
VSDAKGSRINSCATGIGVDFFIDSCSKNFSSAWKPEPKSLEELPSSYKNQFGSTKNNRQPWGLISRRDPTRGESSSFLYELKYSGYVIAAQRKGKLAETLTLEGDWTRNMCYDYCSMSCPHRKKLLVMNFLLYFFEQVSFSLVFHLS